MSELRGVWARAWFGRRALAGALLGLFFSVGAARAQDGAPGYRIQVGAQDTQAGAAELRNKVLGEVGSGHGVYVVEAGGLFKVRIGDFVTRAEASSLLAQVKSMGYADAWVAADQVRLGSAAGGGGAPDTADEEVESPVTTQAPPAPPIIQPSPAPVRPQPNPAPMPERTEIEPAKTDETKAEATEAKPSESDPPSEVEVFPAPRPEASRDEEQAGGRARPAMERPAPEAREWPRVDDGAIRIDGRPSESAWDVAGSGWAKRPSSASGAAPGTSVQFAYDASAFYVATQVTHTRAGALAEAGDAAPSDQERVVVTIRRNGEVASSFGVTVAGVRIRYDDAWDRDADADWQARTATTGDEWSSEIRIPYELLGVQGDEAEDDWEVAVRWEDPKGTPSSSHQQLPMEQFSQVFDFGGGGSVRFAVAPFYQASTAVATASPSWDTPASRVGGRIEVDAGSSFRAQAEIQPDYPDVRPDPATVNLSPYETRFTEHRPFFRGLDNDQNAWAPEWGPSLFYTRRVGGVPGSVLASGVETLQPADLLGVAQVQGEHEGVSYRALGSLTRSSSITLPGVGGNPVFVDVSPQTFLGAARVQHHVSARAKVGASFTGVHRNMAATEPLAAVLVGQAFAGQLDFDFAVSDVARVQAFVGLSHLNGTASALQAVQTSSAHYLQRPDVDYADLNPVATSLTGFSGGVSSRVESGAARFTGRAVAMNPTYNIQDAGFMRSADRILGDAWVGWGREAGRDSAFPGGLDVGAWTEWTFGGVHLRTSPAARAALGSGPWEAQAAFRYDLEGLSADLTRGGPLMATPAGWRASLDATRSHASGAFGVAGGYATDALGGSWIQGAVRASGTVAPGLDLWVEPGYRSTDNPRQYVMSEAGGSFATYGTRYVFAALEHRELFTRFGLGLQLRHGLSLDGYLEPFVSSGAFAGFGELTVAQGNDLLFYGTNGTTITPQPNGEQLVDVGGSQFTIPALDFAVRSFRSQVALGWVPLESAKVTLAWLQGRSSLLNQYDAPSPAHFLDAARDLGSHLFVARVSYELGMQR